VNLSNFFILVAIT